MARSTRNHHLSEVIKAVDSRTVANVPTGSIPRSDLEPLADYLEPQFGNIYVYNLQSDDTGFDVQPWTPELQAAVTHYLMREMAAADWQRFLNELDCVVPDGTRAEQAAFIIAHNEPWVVAYASHLAALNAVRTLDQLIGQLETWPDADLQEDVGVWLNTHASDEQLAELAAITNHPERNAASPWRNLDPTGWNLAENLIPPILLDAWRDVVGQADSDLTDEEWCLLLPLVQERATSHGERIRTDHELLKLRNAFDGIRYKFSKNVSWARIPNRYGTWHAVRQRYVHYRDRGDFARMLSAVQDRPGAARIVKWLERVATK